MDTTEMFCFQCEETTQGTCCTQSGTCGKGPEVAALEDLLIHALEGLAAYAEGAFRAGWRDSSIDEFVHEAIFTTVTNVNFDPESLRFYLLEAHTLRERVREVCPNESRQFEIDPGPWSWEPGATLEDLVRQGREVGIPSRLGRFGEDITSLQELLTYGIKGTAAYAHHAVRLGHSSPEVAGFVYAALASLARGENGADRLVDLCLECGRINLLVMELLDAANTGAYGQPEPTQVRVEPRVGRAILVSGHDLRDLEELLVQTEGQGIDVYTHSEMLPAHGYPDLKKFPHLAGNYGGAWHAQRDEFDAFPGPIVMTSNCIQRPRESYRDRLFTCGPVAWPGVHHIEGYDFSPVIEKALSMDGFQKDGGDRSVLVGFGHQAVLGVADQVVAAVKSGALRHFFLVGGCDGHKASRSYYTEFTEAVPDDSVILTLGCAKYRFNDRDFGDIGGIPRLLDMGQCNDAYSAIRVASALAEAFETDVNGLPLTLNISWYEQKAACILLTLLYLGIRDIRLGPTLPAFVSPGVLQVLVEKFGVGPISTVQQDLATMLGT